MQLQTVKYIRRWFWFVFAILVLDIVLLISVALIEKRVPAVHVPEINLAIGILGVAWLPLGIVLLGLGISYIVAMALVMPPTVRGWGIRFLSFGSSLLVTAVSLFVISFLPQRANKNPNNYLIGALVVACFGIVLMILGRIVRQIEMRRQFPNSK